MSGRNPFEKNPAKAKQGRELRCEEWETFLADALDGVLPAGDAVAFDVHSAKCPACAELLAQAKAGREWLKYLHTEPDVPGDIVSRILSKTSGGAGLPLAVAGGPQPIAPHLLQTPFRKTFYETRLLMTVAMAFFSIALTLNLAGIRLTGFRLADLKPSTLQSNLTHQFYGARYQMVRYYDSLRFVYQMESKMRELRRDAEADQQPAPAKSEQKTTQQSTPTNKTGGKLETPQGSSPSGSSSQALWGRKQLADLEGTMLYGPGLHKPGTTEVCTAKKQEDDIEVGPWVVFIDQAGRSLA
jgi:hypothetical protein